MMRWLFGILLLCNAVALAWQWDVFERWGWGPNTQREPERLLQQIRPDAVTITLPPRPQASDTAAAPSPVLEASASSAAAEAPHDAGSAPASTSAGAPTGAPPFTAPDAPSSAPTPATARPDAKATR